MNVLMEYVYLYYSFRYSLGSLIIVTGIIAITDVDLVSAQRNCHIGLFRCRNGQTICKLDVCDGTKDCDDGSDEMHAICLDTMCPSKTFQCSYGGCVPEEVKCNGIKDCADNSDELLMSCPGFRWPTNSNTSCGPKQFQCQNGDCIKYTDLCNGIPECSDNSDESIIQCHSEHIRCPGFKCAYGACLPTETKCNFVNDCFDRSDEDYVLCNRNKSTEVLTPVTIPSSVKPELTSKPSSTCLADISAPYSCTLSNAPGTSYFCTTDGSRLNPGDRVANWNHLRISCNENYGLPEYFNSNLKNILSCLNGTWTIEKYECFRLCPPIVSSYLDIKCQYYNQQVDCAKQNFPNTIAEINCKEGYFKTGNSFADSRCHSNGLWLPSINGYHCNYKCGELNDNLNIQPLLANSEIANATRHPWNVGLYYEIDGKYIHFCGGTLISPLSIITAAHCMFKGNTTERLVKNKLKIGFGKFNRSWYDEINSNFQERGVSKISVPPTYSGSNLSFLYDVAILELSTPIDLQIGVVMPACLGTNNKYPQKNTTGKVVGWGLTGKSDTSLPSPVLQVAHLPYVPLNVCREYSKLLITDDKFCAFHLIKPDAPYVGEGDSGSGLTFEINGKNYIYGVVSAKIVDDSYKTTKNVISIFVNITHTDIKRFIENHAVL